jgi:hypothetical protein
MLLSQNLGAGMQQLADWLEGLGLGQYAQLFAENGIDLSVLPDLTDQDFEKLGIVPPLRYCDARPRLGRLPIKSGPMSASARKRRNCRVAKK